MYLSKQSVNAHFKEAKRSQSHKTKVSFAMQVELRQYVKILNSKSLIL